MALAAGAFLTPLLASVKSFITAGDELANMASRTGASVEALSELGFAAKQSGSNLETLEMGLRRMQAVLADATHGSSSAVKALASLGLSAQELRGLAPDEQFKRIADRMAAIEDPTMRAALAMDVFGRFAGPGLLPLMNSGAAGIEAMQEAARKMGITMSTESAQAAERLGDTLDVTRAAVARAAQVLGEALVPVVTAFAESVTTAAAVMGKWIKQHQQAAVNIAKTALATLAFGAALTVIGKAITFVATAIRVVIVSVRAASIAFAFLAANPVVLALTAAVAVAGAAAIAFGALKTETTSVAQAFSQIREEGDRLRDTQTSMIGRLQELHQKEALTNEERSEALRLMEELSAQHGVFVGHVDNTTGRLTLLQDRLEQLNRAMRHNAMLELQDEIKALRSEVSRLGEDFKAVGGQALRGLNKGPLWHAKAAEQGLVKYNKTLAKLRESQARFNLLREGDAAAMSQAPAGVTPTPDLGGDFSGMDLGDDLDSWARRVHQLRIELMEDEHARERALINERYDHEVERARGTADLIAQINEARALELQHIDARHTQAAAREKERAAEDVAQRRAQITNSERDLEREISELRLQTALEGVELQEKLLDLQEQFALEDAKASGINPELIGERFDLLRQLQQRADAAGDPERRREVRGTFNPFALQSLQSTPAGILDSVEEPIKETARNTKKIANALEEGGGLTFT